MQSQYTLLLRIESVGWREPQRPCCPSPHLMTGQSPGRWSPGPQGLSLWQSLGRTSRFSPLSPPSSKALKVKHGDDPPRRTTRQSTSTDGQQQFGHARRGAFGYWADMELSPGGNSLYEISSEFGGSQLHIRNSVLDLGRLLLAVSPQWAGGRRHIGTPGWMQSYPACSGFELHSGTYSNRTVRENTPWESLEPGPKA